MWELDGGTSLTGIWGRWRIWAWISEAKLGPELHFQSFNDKKDIIKAVSTNNIFCVRNVITSLNMLEQYCNFVNFILHINSNNEILSQGCVENRWRPIDLHKLSWCRYIAHSSRVSMFKNLFHKKMFINAKL